MGELAKMNGILPVALFAIRTLLHVANYLLFDNLNEHN